MKCDYCDNEIHHDPKDTHSLCMECHERQQVEWSTCFECGAPADVPCTEPCPNNKAPKKENQ